MASVGGQLTERAAPARPALALGAAVLGLTAVRLLLAAIVPLSPDETLYWRYSQHLGWGYIDHPVVNPLMIHAGVSLFGRTALGVRFMSVISVLPLTWALWRAAKALFQDETIAVLAALFLNLSMVVAIGSVAATSDQWVVLAATFALAALAQLYRSGRGAWWLALGAALGVGLLCKYTTLFVGAGVGLWVLAPSQRRWLATPWPWLGAVLALAIASPVAVWNAQHQWASFYYQSGRLAVHALTLRFEAELAGSLIGMLTPPIFVLAAIGLWATLRKGSPDRGQGWLLAAFAAPMLAYFAFHALHQRVQGNWPEAVYPALIVAAAYGAVRLGGGTGALAATVLWSRRLAAPIALGLAAIVYLAAAGLLPPGSRDLRARFLSVGWPDVAGRIEEVRTQSGAGMILAPNYALASLVTYYLPSSTPVEQINERLRWSNEPAPDPRLSRGPVLFICENACRELAEVSGYYRSTTLAAVIPRMGRTGVASTIRLYRMDDARADILNQPNERPRAE